MWLIFLTNLAKKHLGRIPKEEAGQIFEAIEEMRASPFSGDVAKLNKNNWRRRVGNYRIIFQILPKESTIFVLGIARRASTTY